KALAIQWRAWRYRAGAVTAAPRKRPTNSKTSRTRVKHTPRVIALTRLDRAPISANAYWIMVSVAPTVMRGRQRTRAPAAHRLPPTEAPPRKPEVGWIATGNPASTTIGISGRARTIRPWRTAAGTGSRATAPVRSVRPGPTPRCEGLPRPGCRAERDARGP